MKKLIALILTALLLSTMAVAVSAAPGGLVAEAQYGTPVIDGEMDDIYNACTEYVGENQRNGTDTGARSHFRVMWDETHLYIYEFVNDTTLFGADDTIANYQYDTTECCVSLINNEATAYDTTTDWWLGTTPYGELNPDSNAAPLGTDFANAKLAYKVVDGTGYYVEWAFDIAAIGTAPSWGADTVIGLEISVNDNTDNVQRTMCIGWNDASDAASSNPSVFGEVKLLAAPVVEEPAPVVEETPVVEEAPAAVEEAPVVVTAAAQTADPIIAVLALLAISGTAVITRRK